MQVKLKEIIDARDALMTLSQQKLDIKTAYNVSKLLRKINPELEELTKVRQDVINRLAPPGTEITPDVNQSIIQELNVVLEEVVDIPVNKIDLSGKNLELTPREVMTLDPFCLFETVALE